MNKLNAMRAFVSVVDHGSFTASARKLGVSISSATKLVAHLEAELATRLLNRTTRRLVVTEQGRKFYERCRNILAAVDEAETSVRKSNSAIRGQVRMVLPYLFGRCTLLPALPQFFARYPDVDLQLNFSDGAIDLIEAGVDLGVHTGEISTPGLTRRRLTGGLQVTAASPRYIKTFGVPQTPDDLANHNCIWGRFGPDWLFRTLSGGKRMVRVNGNLKVFSGDALREAAVAGLGIVHASWWALRHELAAGRLVQILKDYATEGRPVSVVYPASRYVPAKVRATVDFLVEITKAERPRDGNRST